MPDSKRSGAKKKFTEEDEVWLSEKIHSLSESKTGGCITGKELHQLLAEQQHKRVSEVFFWLSQLVR